MFASGIIIRTHLLINGYCSQLNIGYNILTVEAHVCMGFNTLLLGMVFIVADVKISLNCQNVVPIIVANLMLVQSNQLQ